MLKKVSLLVVFLSIILILGTGCNQDNLMAVNSNLTDNRVILSSLSEIEIEFNHDIEQVKAVIKEDTVELKEFELANEGNIITISNLNLKPGSIYQIVLEVIDEQGEGLQLKKELLASNPTLMQAFYWELDKGEYAKKYSEEHNFWQLLAQRSEDLASVGISELWFPPANKAHEQKDEGYGTYDLWDLGEFDQAGTVRTKYGTKEELEGAIDSLHKFGIKAYYDVVFNHRIAAGNQNLEVVTLATGEKAKAYTKLSPLKGRQQYYSRAQEWQWDWQAFDGVDHLVGKKSLKGNLFLGKSWDDSYAKDYLMALDVDYQNKNVRHELKEWGAWIINDIGFDGFRIDTVQHTESNYVNEWLSYVQGNTEKDVFFVGEAWIRDIMGLSFFLYDVNHPDLTVFDFPLRKQYFEKMRDGHLNMAALSKAGLVNNKRFSDKAVTFVDNHDTGRDHKEYTYPITRRKYQAYTYILLREIGLPMVYWKDYYQDNMKTGLDKLLKARSHYAYGAGREVNNNDADTYSYVREGLKDMPETGLVMIISQGTSGDLTTKRIDSGKSNTEFYDITGNIEERVVTDEEGYGEFKVRNDENTGWSVWVPAI
ncbi:alpha-amylase [Orenia metallireducens]|jgi:alpha-amylase|uniref:alpha-amylase domain-containing protein n=1 Tax=Orenia metallireducens TaxID=1413210 RepID=UPI000D0712AC|nr:alpha-amylase domain-containing protein [Orenia metallireducens]PRX32602.1 alpha-amylase [Orenia metallireducens]